MKGRWHPTNCLALATLTIAVCGVSAGAANGAAGDIDRSFARDGFALVRDAGDQTVTREVVLDDRGRILVLAELNSAYEDDHGIVLVRLRRDGRPDESFGRRGRVKLITDDRPLALAVDSVGRAYVAGADNSGNGWLWRFDTAGRLDRSFADEGAFRFGDGDGDDDTLSRADDVLALEDDSVVVAGELDDQVFVANIDESGNLVPTFGQGGIASTPHRLAPASIAQTTDGKLIVSGTTGNGFGFFGLTITGAKLSTFGPDGFVTHVDPVDYGSAVLTGSAADDSNRLVFAGNECSEGRGTRCRAIVGRIGSNGKLDTSFADNGWWTQTPATVTGVDLQGARIVISATVGPSAGGAEVINMGLFRLRPGGRRDPAFSGDGKAGVDFRFGWDYSGDVAVDRRGRLLVAGATGIQPDPYNEHLLVARYQTADGRIANADGDALPDRRDKCPLITGLRAERGCPAVGRAMSAVLRDDGRLKVEIRSEPESCERARIAVKRRQGGRDKIVAHGKANEYGSWGRNGFVSPKGLYVVAARSRVPGLMRCKAARTRVYRSG